MLFSFSLLLLPYPLMMSVFYFFQVFILIQFEWNLMSFTIPLVNSLFLLLAFIPGIKYQRFIRKQSLIQNEQLLNIDSSFTSVKLKTPSNLPMKLALFSAVGVCFFASNFLFLKNSILQSYGMSGLQFLFGILITSSLCYIIFRRQLYKHHFLALAIVVISSIGYYWGYFQAWKYYVGYLFDGSFGWYVFNQLLVSVLWSFQEVIEYYLMTTHFMSPYLILGSEGVVSLVLIGVYCGIAQVLPAFNDDSYLAFMKAAKWEVICDDFIYIYKQYSYSVPLIIGYVVLGLLMQIFRIQTNKKLSPINRHFSENLYVLFFFIYDLVSSNQSISTLYRFIYTLLLIVAFCIFNEHIIIHMLSLQRNTIKEIGKRAYEEYHLNEIDTEDIELS